MKKYTLEGLIEIFTLYASLSRQTDEKLKKDWEEKNPTEEWPHSSFNINDALVCMCKEIKKIKDRI